MHDQPRAEAYEASDFFADGRASRLPPPGTVARGGLRAEPSFYSGLNGDGSFVTVPPVPVTAALLQRGQERYAIHCTPCHDRVGSGRGMIVRRGYSPPPSFHIPRLREAPVGYFVDVVTRGFGRMPAYAAQVPPADRWAIAVWVRVLQLSQYAGLDQLPAAERQRILAALAAAPAAAPAAPEGHR
jgi:mono/diheme cytochrome c family protein